MARSLPCLGSHNGTVKKWLDKGFGFIEGEDGKEYFVHWSSINQDGFKSLGEGEEVEFDLIENNGKWKAVEVTGPGGAPVQGAPRPDYGGGGDWGGDGGGDDYSYE